jgi:hypothetical protein
MTVERPAPSLSRVTPIARARVCPLGRSGTFASGKEGRDGVGSGSVAKMGAVAVAAAAPVAAAVTAALTTAAPGPLGPVTRVWARTGGRAFPVTPAVICDAGAEPDAAVAA